MRDRRDRQEEEEAAAAAAAARAHPSTSARALERPPHGERGDSSVRQSERVQQREESREETVSQCCCIERRDEVREDSLLFHSYRHPSAAAATVIIMGESGRDRSSERASFSHIRLINDRGDRPATLSTLSIYRCLSIDRFSADAADADAPEEKISSPDTKTAGGETSPSFLPPSLPSSLGVRK